MWSIFRKRPQPLQKEAQKTWPEAFSTHRRSSKTPNRILWDGLGTTNTQLNVDSVVELWWTKR